MSDRRTTFTRRFPAGPGLATAGIAIVLGLGLIGCSETETEFVPLPVATEARILALTLDACDCTTCRVAVQDPLTGRILYNRTGPIVGSTVVVAACYSGLTVRVTLECGLCPGPGPCTATATLTASGDLPAGNPLTCTTPAVTGASCQDQHLLDISDTSPTVSCAP